MSGEQGQVFEVMACASRHGVLDKSMSVLGEAIDGMMADEGVKIGELVNRLDDASLETVMKLDSMLARSGLLLRLASRDRVMAFVSRLLDVTTVRRAIVLLVHKKLARAVAEPSAAAPAAGSAPDRPGEVVA